MSWLSLTRVLSSFVLAIGLIAGCGYFATKYLIEQFTALPPKPVFPNDKPADKAKPATPVKAVAKPASPQASPTPSSKPSPKPEDGYPAKITQSNGMNLRDAPSREANRIGGIDYNQRVVVLEESPDQEWQRVRVEGSNQEGWIKAGATERTN